jgi:DNA-binding transcriptional LysR family regulator
MDRLDQMKTFACVVDAGSLSTAARRLGVSLATVSRQVSSLERELGATLVVRTPRAIAPTDAGRRFHALALQVLQRVEDAEASVRAERAVEGKVVLSTSVTLGLCRIGPMVPALIAAHPRLEIDLRLDDHFVDFVADGIDVAFRTGAPPDSSSVVARPIASWSRCIVASPRYLRAHGVPRTTLDLERHAVIAQLPASGGATRWRLLASGVRHLIEVRAVYRSSAPLAQLNAAIAGVGLALLPDWLVSVPIARGELQQVLTDHEASPVPLVALHRIEMREVPRIRAVIEHVRSAWAAAPPAEKGPVSAKRPRRREPGRWANPRHTLAER